MSEECFVLELSKIGIELDDMKIEQFRLYAEFLKEYNSHTNLTAIKETCDIYLKHFYDSLVSAKYFDFREKEYWISEAGRVFPGYHSRYVFLVWNSSLSMQTVRKRSF